MKLSSLSAPHPGAFSPTEAATDAPELGAPTPPNNRRRAALSWPLSAAT